MASNKPRIHRPIYRIAALAATAIFAASLRWEPSAALPLIAPSLAFRAPASVSLLLNEPADLKLRGYAPSSLHSLLTAAKIDALLAATDIQPLSIATELRTHRVFVRARPTIRFSADLAPGTKKIVRPGVPSITVVTERVTLWSTVVVSRQVVRRAALQRAQPGLIVAGPPRNVAEAMRATGLRRLVAAFAMVATAYTAGSAQAVPTGRTATGVPARYGVVAVDPRVIPLGSHVFIQGYGTAIAADTGGAIIGHRIDLCMDSLQRALHWGRQPVKVYVLQE